MVLTGTAPAATGVAYPVPAHLPRYGVDLSIHPAERKACLRQTVTWTNPASSPTDKLVFNFYPLYRVPRGDRLLVEKTLELLRQAPSDGIDPKGIPATVSRITAGGSPLTFHIRAENPCAVVVELPSQVRPGESVTVEIEATIALPHMQGRWGHWKGVTFLSHALPVVAYFDDRGWHDAPFVPWHQPFWNEAGVYHATITLPANEKLACSAIVAAEEDLGDGWRRVRMQPFVGRDFAVICSSRFHEFCAQARLPDGREVTVKCLAFDHHAHAARACLNAVVTAIPIFSQWFGPFPYDQFTVVESYFGWNGNECGGLVMIDERVFDLPPMMRGYIEYLVTHETCHQWWYNLVGTNGFSETFVDEGLATHLTHRLIDHTRGKNNELVDWPGGGKRLPNIKRDNYRYSSIYGAIRRGDAPAAAGDLTEFGNLVALFSGAYDRGSKVFGMIEERLGPEFLPFLGGIVRKYAFRVLSADQLKQELIAFCGPQSTAQWEDFFRRWVYSNGLVDWHLDSVRVDGRRYGPILRRIDGPDSGGVRVEVIVSQRREYDEPTVIGFQFAEGDGYPVRVPIGALKQPTRIPECDAEVEPLPGGRLAVRLTLPRAPVQVDIDPDRVLLDANPANNRWRADPNVRVVPVYTFLYDNTLTNDYDRWNITAGGWFWGPTYLDPWYTRTTMIGARVGAFRSHVFSGGAYAAYRADYEDVVAGADGLVDHWPFARSQVGFNYERRIGGPHGGDGEDTAERGTIFLRHVLQYSSSLYLHPMHYVEAYSSYSDNFLPVARTDTPGAVRPGSTFLSGLHHRLNLYTPYWNPEHGVFVDLVAAGGTARLQDDTLGSAQVRGELSMVHPLPRGLGYLSSVRAAGRVAVHAAWPEEGQFYSLGGSQLLRGFDIRERQGSTMWLANAELRFPVVEDARMNLLRNIIGVRNVMATGFYDVGNVYVNGDSVGGTAHALGAGVRVEFAFISFIERATVRFDVAKTINEASPFQFWFGVQNPF